MALIATKTQRYGTRALKAGDPFPAVTPRRRRLLIGLGKAREGEAQPQAKAPAPQEVATPAGEDIAAVRTEYLDAVGRKPFHGWDIDTLRQKIAEASAPRIAAGAGSSDAGAED